MIMNSFCHLYVHFIDIFPMMPLITILHPRNKCIHSSQKYGNRQGIRADMIKNAASVYHHTSGGYIASDGRWKYCEGKSVR